MKKNKLISRLLGITLGAVVSISGIGATTIDVYAAHDVKATVTGTVESGSNASTLNLKTAQGDMVIKIDGDTTMNTKLMTPGATLYVDVYYGSDAYMHAAQISANNSGKVVSSNSKTYEITGKVANKQMNDNILYVDMGDDQMQLKLDSTTDYSNCGMLYAGKSISASIYRGDDAYMHAYSISDGNGTSTTYTSSASSSSNNSSYTAVTGTVGADTKNGNLYLETKDGTYTLKLDGNTNYSNGYMVIKGKKITAYVYRGSDAYMHVASIERTGNLSNTSSGSTTMTFTGKVKSDSDDGKLSLSTNGGDMIIRLDANTNCSSAVLVNSTVTVSAVNCSDEYWHASSISVN